MAVEMFCYRNRNSILSKIPALAKLIFIFVLCISVFMDCRWEKLKLGICFFLTVILFILGKCNFKTVTAMKYVLTIGTLILLLRSFTYTPEASINVEGFWSGVEYTVRLFITALACQIIFETTSPMQIQGALESVEYTVAKIVPPVKKIHAALLISLAINFMPMVFETWNKIQRASLARSRKTRNPFIAIRNSMAQFEALFSCLLFKAEIKRRAILNRGNYD